jgi:hypothetical protein
MEAYAGNRRGDSHVELIHLEGSPTFVGSFPVGNRQFDGQIMETLKFKSKEREAIMNGNPNTHSAFHGRSIYRNNFDPYGNWWHEERPRRRRSTRSGRTGSWNGIKGKTLQFATVVGVCMMTSMFVVDVIHAIQ